MNPEEIELLRKVNFAVSDYLMGCLYPKFAEENGGLEGLFDALEEAHEEYERLFNTEIDHD